MEEHITDREWNAHSTQYEHWIEEQRREAQKDWEQEEWKDKNESKVIQYKIQRETNAIMNECNY